MINYILIHKKRQQIAKNTGSCTQLQHAINLDAHDAILKGYTSYYVRAEYGIDFAAYNRLKKALLSDKMVSNFKQFETSKNNKETFEIQ